jgi:hypothetical protein
MPSMWIHPALQLFATIAGGYVFYLGIRRFMMLHMKKKVPFNWKGHVLWGKIAIALWIAGMGLGLFFAWMGWGAMLITGWHYIAGFIIIPLAAAGFATGYVLDKYKKKRAVLPLAHGINNLVLMLLILFQLYTGVLIIRDYLL